MKTEELKITIPEDHEIDWQESAKQEKIVFKKKDTKPRSWKEYCQLQKESNAVGYFIDSYCGISEAEWSTFWIETNEWRSTIPSKELAEAFLAMMQLMSLRQEWIHKYSLEIGLTKDWEPDWKNSDETKYCLIQLEDVIKIYKYNTENHTLSFPTEEMAEDFVNCFKDLLNVARPLI